MFHNAQELSESASDYKKLTLTKNLSKKRGRACNKKTRNTSLDSRIVRDQLILSHTLRELRRETNQFDKAGNGTPNVQLSDAVIALRESAKIAEGNLSSARSAKAGMDRFPPMR